MIGRGQCDFVVEVAAELPLRIIADLLGAPQSACYDIFDWTNRMIGSQDPEYSVSERSSSDAAREMFSFANGLAEDRLERPRDDLMSTILHGEVNGQRLNAHEFDNFFLLLAVAGNETTRNLISHALLPASGVPRDARAPAPRPLAHPGAGRRGAALPLAGVLHAPHRHRDTELEGRRIRKGDKLLLYYPARTATRRCSSAPTSSTSTAGRTRTSRSVSASTSAWARTSRGLETRVMFEGVLERMRDLELAGPVTYLRSNLIDGVKHIPLKFSGSAAHA